MTQDKEKTGPVKLMTDPELPISISSENLTGNALLTAE